MVVNVCGVVFVVWVVVCRMIECDGCGVVYVWGSIVNVLS